MTWFNLLLIFFLLSFIVCVFVFVSCLFVCLFYLVFGFVGFFSMRYRFVVCGRK